VSEAEGNLAVQSQLKETFAAFGLTEEHTLDAFEHIMSDAPPQVIVSTRDFQAVIAESKTLNVLSIMQQLSQAHTSVSGHPRPDLPTPFVAARNETERIIAEIWQEIFGIEQVGIHDKYFDLGGTSLLAIQLINRLRNAFGQEVAVNIVFECPTIAEMAEVIGATQLAREDREQVDRIFDEIKDLSPEELQLLFDDDSIYDERKDANA
jgi:hypothetical protein